MADSELKELKRLRRAGFEVQRIHLHGTEYATGDSAAGTSIETTVEGSKAQFTYVSEALVPTADPSTWRVDVPAADEAEVSVQKGAITLTLNSSSKDFVDYVLTLHPSLDFKGNSVLRRFADNGRYWAESKDVFDRMRDRKAAIERLMASKRKVDGKLRTLLIELLRTRDWGASRFVPLRDQFVELEGVLISESSRLMQIQQRLYANNPEAKKYGDLVEELLNAAVWFHDEPFIKRALRFFELVRFDVLEAVSRAFEQRKHVDDLLGMLAKRSPLPGRKGLPHLLDMNRRLCETLRPFIDALSDAVCLVEGVPRLSPNTGYTKRVEVIKRSKFAEIVACLDPDIRHSESHDGTFLDDEKGRVLLTDVGDDGQRRTLGEYSYWQISDMTLDLQNGLFVAVLTAFALHEMGVLATTVVSSEYFKALTSFGNLAAD